MWRPIQAIRLASRSTPKPSTQRAGQTASRLLQLGFRVGQRSLRLVALSREPVEFGSVLTVLLVELGLQLRCPLFGLALGGGGCRQACRRFLCGLLVEAGSLGQIGLLRSQVCMGALGVSLLSRQSVGAFIGRLRQRLSGGEPFSDSRQFGLGRAQFRPQWFCFLACLREPVSQPFGALLSLARLSLGLLRAIFERVGANDCGLTTLFSTLGARTLALQLAGHVRPLPRPSRYAPARTRSIASDQRCSSCESRTVVRT